MQRGTFKLMKSVNKSLILNQIRMNEPTSRAQIAKDTKLTPPTVSSIVKELIEEKIVLESELGESKGGRKPTMLLIDNSHLLVVGVDVGPNTVECILSNISGEILHRNSKSLPKPLTNEQFLTILKETIKDIILRSDSSGEIIGIGIAMHGVVDVKTGTSLFAPNLQLTDIPIKQELENEFNLDIHIENDARAMALGESWFGNHGPLSSMLAVNLGSGVGAGFVIDGKLYHGAMDLAGEIGHMTIDMNGPICECGDKGCLQTFATGAAIIERANRLEFSEKITSGEEVYQLALASNENAVHVLEQTGDIIGVGLTNLIHIINPERIVIGGGVSKSGQFILPSIIKRIQTSALTPEAKHTKVVISELGDDATLLGAVALLLNKLFNYRS